jgi:hypothetical protein
VPHRIRARKAAEGLGTYCFSASSAEKSHKLYSAALPATILNDVSTFSVGGAFLDLRCLFAYNAVQKTDQRAFIVVQMIFHSYRLHFPFAFSLTQRRAVASFDRQWRRGRQRTTVTTQRRSAPSWVSKPGRYTSPSPKPIVRERCNDGCLGGVLLCVRSHEARPRRLRPT